MHLGKSFPGVVCRSLDERKQSINLYGTSPAFKAESVAHEIGHNLGMSHDFNWRHGGTGCAFSSTNPCNGRGFMSYGNHLSQWSECSVKDLAAHYAQNKENWCMPGNFNLNIFPLCYISQWQNKIYQPLTGANKLVFGH